MVMGGEDKEFKARQERIRKRKMEEQGRVERASQEKAAAVLMSYEVETIESSVEESVTSGSDVNEMEVSTYCRRKCQHKEVQDGASGKYMVPDKRFLMDDSKFAASLDRTKTSMREAMHIVGPALNAAGIDIDHVTLSKSSLHRARKQARQDISSKVQKEFCPSSPLIVHFDGKMLPDDTGKMVDRMAVIASGSDIEKLLGIPKIPTGTGVTMGETIIKLIHDWHLEDVVAGLCFDTTSVNTGINTGAITTVQQAFDKRLLFLACRHHVYEIIASAVFDKFFTSSGPQIVLFGRLKEHWPSIDQTKFVPITKETEGFKLTENELQWFEQNTSEIADFIHNALKETHPRHDYLEFLRLSAVALGKPELVNDENGSDVHFTPPGAYHRARWMAKGIYCLKICCFREQFPMSKHERQAIRRICLFTLTLYVKAWFSAPCACDAPYNDLCLLQQLEVYLAVDGQVANVALSKLRSHLWYLSEDLILLALFSKKVHSSEKQLMVRALQQPSNDKDLRRVDGSKIKKFQQHCLSDFVSSRSMNLFEALKLSRVFLDSDPEQWPGHADFEEARETVQALKVVNDSAERAVKLASDFNEVLTRDEDERQIIYQVVEYHRKLYTEPLKKLFM